ncbi:hypothetical protein IE4803_PB00023 (plasmid) [Rhizobium etli bv. phaseoli str. IE4803]|nr:hypothetical protein IE4803_PB00023 [Rhizobium etli bv. phaseoli str. IE4803]
MISNLVLQVLSVPIGEATRDAGCIGNGIMPFLTRRGLEMTRLRSGGRRHCSDHG